MSYTVKKLSPTEVELMLAITPGSYQKYLAPAAERLSHRVKIHGFRPGKIPYEVLKRQLGEMAILEEALTAIIQDNFYAAVQSEKLTTVGMPNIQFDKLAPGNDIVCRATVALLPQVKVADLKKIRVVVESKPVTEKQVDKTIEALRGLQAKEVIKNGPAAGTDKVVIDLHLTLDKVTIEGGQAKDYQVYLGEKHYVPGFNEQVAGLKKGDEKQFSLKFPTTHYQKQLAGKQVDFAVKVKDVYERQLPALTDELAKRLGQESVAKLKELIRRNLAREAAERAQEQAEISILNQLIEHSEFEPIPPIIIDAEKQKMFFELKRDLERHGVGIDDYLRDLKKTEAEIRQDFTTPAERRAKAALLSRQLAQEQNLKISEAELESELKMMREVYKDDPAVLDNLKRRDGRDSVATTLQNKKVMAWLWEKIIPDQPRLDSKDYSG